MSNWVNGDLYSPTTEVLGILPVPPNIQTASDILSYDPDVPSKKYPYLARKQGTHFAVLTVNTDVEKKLFSDFMMNDPIWSEATGPRWAQAVKSWNRKADGNLIFYKVCRCSYGGEHVFIKALQLVEHLKTYYTTWKTSMNAKHTRMATYDTRKETDALVRNHDVRLQHAPAVPEKPPVRALPTRGLIPAADLQPEPTYPRIQYPSTSARIQVRHGVEEVAISDRARTSQKRVHNQVSSDESCTGGEYGGPQTESGNDGSSSQQNDEEGHGGSRKRARRTCWKCGAGEGCRGNNDKTKCLNPCRDCGERACTGRDRQHRTWKCPTVDHRWGETAT